MEIKRYKVFVTIGYIGIETRNVSFLSTRELGASLRTEQWHKYELSQFRGSPYMRHNAAAFPFSTTPPLSPRFFRPRITHWKTFRAATQLICPVVASFRFISAGKEKERIVHHALSRLSHGRHVLARHSASASLRAGTASSPFSSPLSYFPFFPSPFFLPLPLRYPPYSLLANQTELSKERAGSVYLSSNDREIPSTCIAYIEISFEISNAFLRFFFFSFFYLQPFRPKRCTIRSLRAHLQRKRAIISDEETIVKRCSSTRYNNGTIIRRTR